MLNIFDDLKNIGYSEEFCLLRLTKDVIAFIYIFIFEVYRLQNPAPKRYFLLMLLRGEHVYHPIGLRRLNSKYIMRLVGCEDNE
jgi:hypothetical protein